LVFPLSNLLATGQIELGDLVTIDYATQTSKLTFVKEDRGALVGAATEGTPAPEAVLVSISGARPAASKTRAVGAKEKLAS
jgi:hypothetical protein